jgi:hypothetical protein
VPLSRSPRPARIGEHPRIPSDGSTHAQAPPRTADPCRPGRFAASLLTPVAAKAAYYGTETDYAVAATPSGDLQCDNWKYARVCLKSTGDLIYVYDESADGRSAVAQWHTPNYPRWGSCVNKLGKDHWGVCNKNFAEGTGIALNAAVYDNGNWSEQSSYWMFVSA